MCLKNNINFINFILKDIYLESFHSKSEIRIYKNIRLIQIVKFTKQVLFIKNNYFKFIVIIITIYIYKFLKI